MTPRSPAHLGIATGRGAARVPNDQIIHLQTSARRLTEAMIAIGVSDRHPLARDACITVGVGGLDTVDWAAVRVGNFAKSVEDPTRAARIGAEVFVRAMLPFVLIDNIACWNGASADVVRAAVSRDSERVRVEVRPDQFFKAGT